MRPPCSAITVVVVDDDPSFRIGLAANLEDDGHRVRVFADPREVPPDALRDAQVVVTDYQMAEIDGLTFAGTVHAANPAIRVVLATAYWTVEVEAAVVSQPHVRLCRKPMDYDQLHGLLHELAAGR